MDMLLLHGGLVLQLKRPGNGDGLRTMVLVSMVRGATSPGDRPYAA